LLSSLSFIPLYLPAIVEGVLPIVRHFFGNISFVSLRNTLPQVKKNTFVVLTISIMMLIVVFGSTFIKTIQKGDEAYINKQYETEIVMTNQSMDNTSVNAMELKHTVEKLNSVTNVSTQSRQGLGEIKYDSNYTKFDY